MPVRSTCHINTYPPMAVIFLHIFVPYCFVQRLFQLSIFPYDFNDSITMANAPIYFVYLIHCFSWFLQLLFILFFCPSVVSPTQDMACKSPFLLDIVLRMFSFVSQSMLLASFSPCTVAVNIFCSFLFVDFLIFSSCLNHILRLALIKLCIRFS